jgi:hypothetical protein
MKFQTSFISVWGLARAAAAMTFLAFPAASQAQQGPINGAVSGAAQGTYQGKTAAGPVGGLVGGAVGAGVGAVAGTLGAIGDGAARVVQPADVPPPPRDASGRTN